jgi:hypothetical protein
MATPVGDPPAEFTQVLESLVEALDRINDTLRQFGGLEQPRAVLREQPLQPLMPRLIAGQWFVRDGDHFPRGT